MTQFVEADINSDAETSAPVLDVKPKLKKKKLAATNAVATEKKATKSLSKKKSKKNVDVVADDHKASLDKLKDIDPEFYKYLEQNDKKLLKFNADIDDEDGSENNEEDQQEENDEDEDSNDDDEEQTKGNLTFCFQIDFDIFHIGFIL